MPMERITLLCFGASYGLALILEAAHPFQPRWARRWLIAAVAGAGLAAHTMYLIAQRPPLATQFGSVVFLAWILAVFYLYGSLHHRRVAWGVFVLPLVVGLVALASGFGAPTSMPEFEGSRFWQAAHGILLLLAAVGVSVGFFASMMYLVQSRRLKAKTAPGSGLRLLSLERLETMNRRAIILAFPLLTAGILIGTVLSLQGDPAPRTWTDPKVVGAGILWVIFALLLYLRYSAHVGGRRLALLTILAFALFLLTLIAPPHPFIREHAAWTVERGPRTVSNEGPLPFRVYNFRSVVYDPQSTVQGPGGSFRLAAPGVGDRLACRSPRGGWAS